MAVESKTEHAGGKNSSHDKYALRADLKAGSKKLRRAGDRAATSADALLESLEEWLHGSPVKPG